MVTSFSIFIHEGIVLSFQQTGFYEDPETATSYYYCNFDTKYGVQVQCDPDTYEWNKEQQACVPPQYNQVWTCLH